MDHKTNLNYSKRQGDSCSAHYPTLAAIDLGTNSCRLLIATLNIARLGRTFFRYRNHTLNWKIIDSFAKVVRLGEGLHKTEELTDEAIERTLEALTICKEKIDYYGVTRFRAVATEACRKASNTSKLLIQVKEKIGISLDVISSDEEIKLALMGCSGVLDRKFSYAIVFDIGGGSTEVVWLKIDNAGKRRPGYPVPFEIIDSISLPYGVVILSEAYAQFTESAKIYNDITNLVKSKLEKFVENNHIKEHIRNNDVQTIGSSGTVTTLSAVQMNLQRYERKLVDGVKMNFNNLITVGRKILTMSLTERGSHPCIGNGRSDLIIVGSAILEGIYKAINSEYLYVADRGVREGILSELLLKSRQSERKKIA